MRHTNVDFQNTFTNAPAPVYLRFDASSAGSLVVLDQTRYLVYFDAAANYEISSSPKVDLLGRLAELKTKYSTAWLPNSTRPNDSAFQNARDFVLTLPLNRIVKPAIHVASDGEVNFQWSGPDFHIDLGFYGNGKFSFYGSKDGSQPILGDDASVKEGIPKGLVDLASAV
jgi:hypothetical protein